MHLDLCFSAEFLVLAGDVTKNSRRSVWRRPDGS